MGLSVALYRGSFDPPHTGHAETALSVLRCGIDRTIITFVDPNSQKPERKSDAIRSNLLGKLFEQHPQVMISKWSFKQTLDELLNDPTIAKVSLLIGSDLLSVKFKPLPPSDKLGCLVIPRLKSPYPKDIISWNGLPVKPVMLKDLTEQGSSSSEIRQELTENRLVEAKRKLTGPVLEEILSHNYYPSFLNQVIHEIVPESEKPFSFHEAKQGCSSDLVFFICNRVGKKILVAKIFADETDFEAECNAYQTLGDLPFQTLAIPKLLYKGKQLIVTNFAEGKPLAELMEKSSVAIDLCAKASAELHGMEVPQVSGELPRAEISSAALETYISLLEESSPEIRDRLRSKWDTLSQNFIKNPGKTCMIHGDLNHFNALVDLENERVTYIDFVRFSKTGFAMSELYEAMLCFWTAAKKVGGMDSLKLEAIRCQYKRSYLIYAPRSITQEAALFFQAYWSLRIIGFLLSQGKNPEREIVNFLSIGS
jgi:nicotinic acid mononucleotide adenylyltransferase